jgi:gas vesicle protein
MSNSSKILLGFLAGAAIGGALGILLAPDKGSETRRRIVERGSEFGDSISDFGETVKEKFNDVVDGVKDSFHRAKNSMS